MIKSKASSSEFTKIDFELLIACCAISCLGNALICVLISVSTSFIKFSDVDTKITWLSVQCYAWLNKSEAT